MTAVTDQGFDRTRLDERYEALVADMRVIFGSDINVDPDSIDGQTLGIFAEMISNLDQLAETIYHSFNPQSATGAALSRLVQLNGIRRIPGSYSKVMLTVVGQVGTSIPAGSLVQSTSNVIFAVQEDVLIPSTGTVDVMALATQVGPQLAPAGTVTKIATPIFGWQSVNNVLDATPGRFEETDEQLRLRRRASTSTPGVAVLDSIYGALANLDNVVQALVMENYTGVTDANGLPPHSIYAVVNGGDDNQIAETIWLKKTAGATLYGNESVVINDSLGNPHQIKFGRPDPVEIYVNIVLTKKPGWPTGGETLIKDAIVNWANTELQIGEELIRTRLFEAINSIPGHSVSVLGIDTTSPGSGTVDIAIPFDGLAMFDSSRITVTAL